jgi:hypothetical protein
MRQRLEIVPVPDPIDGVEFPQKLQQVILGPGRIGGCCADPARQPICPLPLLLIGD